MWPPSVDVGVELGHDLLEVQLEGEELWMLTSALRILLLASWFPRWGLCWWVGGAEGGTSLWRSPAAAPAAAGNTCTGVFIQSITAEGSRWMEA